MRSGAPLTYGRRAVCHPAGSVSGDSVPQLSLHTSVGDLTVSEEHGRIVALDWGWGRDQAETALLVEARAQLHAYFDRVLTRFDLPLAPRGSAYRRCVWQALAAIPHGQTRSYAQVASVAGGSARSVGQAVGANPIPILIPCHRVLAANGLGGFSGGDGTETKRILLDLECGERAVPIFSHAGRRGIAAPQWRPS
jgi:methylated-DNA-[protein]-cysteine S-methyltransferase